MFTGSDGGDIVFPELTSLAIEYDQHRVRSDQQLPRLHFPKLRMANVRCYTDDMPLLYQAVFPAQMTGFEIMAPAALFLLLDGVEMPRVERLKVKLAGYADKPDAMAAVNRFLNRVRGCRHKELEIDSSSAVVAPELITCTELTSLTLRAEVSIDEVVAFIERLPSLLTLESTSFTTRGRLVDVSIDPLDEHEQVEPLNASLQSLELLPHEVCDEDYMVAVVKYLLLRLPRLALFPANHIPRPPVIDFARAYAHIYPHLANAANVFMSSR
ncbi:hypothetical protein H4R19_002271 [Coemansia spiralis]|nr:hypothetical protein H4R19_002271 [Coemansia spiralis]